MIGGAQTVNLEIPGCVHRSVAAHEAIHALGKNCLLNKINNFKFLKDLIMNMKDQIEIIISQFFLII